MEKTREDLALEIVKLRKEILCKATVIKQLSHNDPVLSSLRLLVKNYADHGPFEILGQTIPAKDLVVSLEIGDDIGNEFRRMVHSEVIGYMMGFADE